MGCWPIDHEINEAVIPSMRLEQALFTSAQTKQAQGYHLVARSPGIDDRLAQQLSLWSPSQNALIERDIDGESLNYFTVDGEWMAISRTVYAGAEYSDRGEFRLETNIIAIHCGQLSDVEIHPIEITRCGSGIPATSDCVLKSRLSCRRCNFRWSCAVRDRWRTTNQLPRRMKTATFSKSLSQPETIDS